MAPARQWCAWTGVGALHGGAALIPVVTRDCRVCSDVTVQHKVETRARHHLWLAPGRLRHTPREPLHKPDQQLQQPLPPPGSITEGSKGGAPQDSLVSPGSSNSTAQEQCSSYNQPQALGGQRCRRHGKQSCWQCPAGAPLAGQRCTSGGSGRGRSTATPRRRSAPGVPWARVRGMAQPPLEPDPSAEAPVHPGPALGELQAASAASLGSDALAQSSQDWRDAAGAPGSRLSCRQQSLLPSNLARRRVLLGVRGLRRRPGEWC